MSSVSTSGSADPDSRFPPRGRLAAIALMCGGLMLFSCLDTSAKFLGRSLSPIEVSWARYMGAAAFAFFLSGAHRNPKVWVAKAMGLQSLRSALLLASTIANFFALTRLQLAETSTINFLQPMFVALMSGPLIGERVGGAQIVAIVVGFGGVLLAIQPGASAFQPIVIVSIASAACSAGYSLATRRLAAHDAPQTTLAWTQLAGVVSLTPLLPIVWKAPPTPSHWLMFILVGMFGAVGHYLVILAHQRAPASFLTPFNYTQLIWMICLGFVVFGDVPPLANIAGAGVVVGCGLFLIWRERRATALAVKP